MADCFIGEIRMFAGVYNPVNWALCDGQTMRPDQMPALFALIGTNYGGDGVTTFKVPDLRGRVPVGQGTNTATNPPLTPRRLGQTGGAESHTLTMAEMPPHTHAVSAVDAPASSRVPGPMMLYAQAQPNAALGLTGLYTEKTDETAASVVQLDTTAVTFAGDGKPHDNTMATTAIRFIMALQGSFPMRAE